MQSEGPFHYKWPPFFSESPFHRTPDPHFIQLGVSVSNGGNIWKFQVWISKVVFIVCNESQCRQDFTSSKMAANPCDNQLKLFWIWTQFLYVTSKLWSSPVKTSKFVSILIAETFLLLQSLFLSCYFQKLWSVYDKEPFYAKVTEPTPRAILHIPEVCLCKPQEAFLLTWQSFKAAR